MILNDYLNHSLVEVGLETGGQSRNKLFITEAKPRRKPRSHGLESGDHAGRTSPVTAGSGGAEGGGSSDPAPAYTYSSGLIKSNETGTAPGGDPAAHLMTPVTPQGVLMRPVVRGGEAEVSHYLGVGANVGDFCRVKPVYCATAYHK